MAFTTSYENKGKNLLPEGTYEAVCTQCVESATKGGTLYLQLRLLVRDDIKQPSAGAVHFEAVFKKKQPDTADQAVGGYSAKRIMQISEAFGIPSGTRFDSLEDWCSCLLGRHAKMVIAHDTYNGEKNARVKWFNASSLQPYRKAEEELPTKEELPFEEVELDDLPF